MANKQIKDFNLLTNVVGNQDNLLVQRENGTTFRVHISDLSIEWTKIMNTPTTLAGYGITDGGGASSTNGNFYTLSYNELVTLQSTNGLVAGSYYMINDYRTCYIQPDFDYNGSPLSGTYKESEIEPIIVLALSENKISSTAYQPKYPNDRIRYDINKSILENGSNAYGLIIERIDEYNNRTNYDHRNVLFKRYRSYYSDEDIIDGLVTINNFTITGTNTYFTNLSTSGYVLINQLVYKIIEIIDNTNMIVEGHIGSYYNDIKISKAYPYNENEYYNCLEWKQNNIIDDVYFKEYKTFQNEYEIQEDYGLSRYNYIGDSENDYFYLPNNIFGMESYNNILGNNIINNHFYRMQNNVINNYMQRNVFYDSFSENHILNYFQNNLGYENFDDNKIGNGFEYNTIYNDFENNEIGDYFQYNTIYNDFEDNIIGIGFYYNLTYERFEDNTICSEFSNNRIYNTFEYNKIGHYFYSNTIHQYFYNNIINDIFENNSSSSGYYDFNDNVIGKSFKGNLLVSNFIKNTIDSDFSANILHADFTNNRVGHSATINNFYLTTNNIIGNNLTNNDFGNNFESNVLGNNFTNNNIGTNFTNNRIGDDFEYNTIINYFLYNIIGMNFSNNTIGYYFTNNIIGNNFESNVVVDNVSNNKLGNNISNNTFSDTFNNNVLIGNANGNNFGNGCNNNIINCALLNCIFGSSFSDNTLFASNESTNYTSYIPLYNTYTCTVKKGSNNLIYLEYFDGTIIVYTEIE